MSYSLMYIFQIITNQPLHLWSACGMRAHRLAKEEELEAGGGRPAAQSQHVLFRGECRRGRGFQADVACHAESGRQLQRGPELVAAEQRAHPTDKHEHLKKTSQQLADKTDKAAAAPSNFA